MFSEPMLGKRSKKLSAVVEEAPRSATGDRKAAQVFFGVKKSPPSPQSVPLSSEHVLQWNTDEIPRYPPFMKGLPIVPPDKLLETQQDLLARIANP